MNNHQILEKIAKKTGNQYQYYLSEISIFMYLEETTAIPSCWKLEILKHLNLVAEKQEIEDRKWLILKAKVRYNLSFATFLQFLNILKKKGEQQLYMLMTDVENTKQNFWKLYSTLPYIFLMNESI